MEAESREEYIRRQEQELQKMIVNVKSSSTPTTATVTWTHRTTACDVISIITTASVSQNGNMKDIRESGEVGAPRIRPPMKTHGILLNNPLEEAVLPDASKEQRRLNTMLLSEKATFMSKLEFARKLRSKAENVAAVILQTYFRRYYVLKHFVTIQRNALLRKRYRAEIMRRLSARMSKANANESLGDVGNNGSVNDGSLIKRAGLERLGEYRAAYTRTRNEMAARVQRAYRCFLSRRLLRNKRAEIIPMRRFYLILKIQCIVRRFNARFRVRRLLARRREATRAAAALVIQNSYRKRHARAVVFRRRYKLHFIASRMIQSWFRGCMSKERRNRLELFRDIVRRNVATFKIQRMARRFICRSLDRLSRIRRRRHFVRRFKAAAAIQSVARRYNARATTASLRKERVAATEAAALLRTQEEVAALMAASLKEAAEEEELLLATNMLHHARLGHLTEVADLYTAALEGGGLLLPHLQTDLDDGGQGDTVLSIAAACGWKDIVFRCLEIDPATGQNSWRFDVNYRNPAGATALMLAVRNNRVEIVRYLLSEHYANGKREPGVEEVVSTTQIATISAEDGAEMLKDAVHHGHEKGNCALLQLLLDAHCDVTAKHPLTDETVLHSICKLGNSDMYKIVTGLTELRNIEKVPVAEKHEWDTAAPGINNCGIDIRSKDEDGLTHLHRACGTSNIALVMNLLNVVADEDGRFHNTTIVPDSSSAVEAEGEENSEGEEGADGASALPMAGSESPPPPMVKQLSRVPSVKQLSRVPSQSALSRTPSSKVDNSAGAAVVSGELNDPNDLVTEGLPVDEDAGADEQSLALAEERAEAECAKEELRIAYLSYNSSWKRRITMTDVNGKDCLLHAALHGQTEVLELLQSLVYQEEQEEKAAAAAAKAAQEEDARMAAEAAVTAAAAAPLEAIAAATTSELTEKPKAVSVREKPEGAGDNWEKEMEAADGNGEGGDPAVQNEVLARVLAESEAREKEEEEAAAAALKEKEETEEKERLEAEAKRAEVEAAAAAQALIDEIGWSPNDIATIFRSVITRGKTTCLAYLLKAGFDPVNMIDEDSGCSSFMLACSAHQKPILDLLLEHMATSKDGDVINMDLTLDKVGRNCWFYAAVAVEGSGMIPYLLSHAHASKVSLSRTGLTRQDNFGWNILHTAVRESVNIITSSELLIRAELQACAAQKDSTYGLTPLLLACSMKAEDQITLLLQLDGDASKRDRFQHNALWHLWRRSSSIQVPTWSNFKYEHVPDTAVADASPTTTGDEIVSFNEEEEGYCSVSDFTVVSLLRAGCALFTYIGVNEFAPLCLKPLTPKAAATRSTYSTKPMPRAEVAEYKPYRPELGSACNSSSISEAAMEAAEVLVRAQQFKYLRLFVQMQPEDHGVSSLISASDAWRLALLCIKYSVTTPPAAVTRMASVAGSAVGSTTQSRTGSVVGTGSVSPAEGVVDGENSTSAAGGTTTGRAKSSDVTGGFDPAVNSLTDFLACGGAEVMAGVVSGVVHEISSTLPVSTPKPSDIMVSSLSSASGSGAVVPTDIFGDLSPYQRALCRLLTITYHGYTLLGWCVLLAPKTIVRVDKCKFYPNDPTGVSANFFQNYYRRQKEADVDCLKYLLKLYYVISTSILGRVTTPGQVVLQLPGDNLSSSTNSASVFEPSASLCLSPHQKVDIHGNTLLHLVSLLDVPSALDVLHHSFGMTATLFDNHFARFTETAGKGSSCSCSRNRDCTISITFTESPSIPVQLYNLGDVTRLSHRIGNVFGHSPLLLSTMFAGTDFNHRLCGKFQVPPRDLLNFSYRGYVLAIVRSRERSPPVGSAASSEGELKEQGQGQGEEQQQQGQVQVATEVKVISALDPQGLGQGQLPGGRARSASSSSSSSSSSAVQGNSTIPGSAGAGTGFGTGITTGPVGVGEANCQASFPLGVFDADDETYFPTAPDPCFVSHYGVVDESRTSTISQTIIPPGATGLFLVCCYCNPESKWYIDPAQQSAGLNGMSRIRAMYKRKLPIWRRCYCYNHSTGNAALSSHYSKYRHRPSRKGEDGGAADIHDASGLTEPCFTVGSIVYNPTRIEVKAPKSEGGKKK